MGQWNSPKEMVRVEAGEEKQQSIMFSPLKNELQKVQGNLRDMHPLFIIIATF